MTTHLQVSQQVNAPAEAAFDLISDPARHHEADASRMVGAVESNNRPTAVGDVFTMNMRRRVDGDIVDYQTDNHITAFEAPRVIEWAVAARGKEPFGWRWRYEITPNDGGCDVTLIYDWSHASEEVITDYPLPAFKTEHLQASLTKFKETLES